MGGHDKKTTLGEVAELLTGFPFKSVEFTEAPSDLRLLRGDNVAQGVLRWDGVKRWPADKAGDHREYLLRPGDVVLAMDRPWIEAGLKHATLVEADCPSLLVQRVACLRARSCLNQRFLGYVIRSRDFTNYILGVQTGTAVPHISSGQIKAYEFFLPSFAHQEKAADLLGSLDNKIELNRRMNETLEAMARAIFKDWFVDFGPTRAKMEGRPPYLAPDLWSLFPARLDENGKPEGWEERRLEDILELAYGKALILDKRKDGPVPVYGSGGITGYHNESLFDGPSIVVGRKGTVGSLYWEDRPFFPIDTVFYVKPKAPLTFCFYLLQTLGLDGMNTDAAVPGLNRNNAYRLPVPWPSKLTLQAFDNVAKSTRRKIRALLEESDTLAQTRDLLLPKLMSGEIRVHDAEALVEAAE